MEGRDDQKESPQFTFSKILQVLKQIIIDSRAEIEELAVDHAVLVGRIVSKELSWEQEKKELRNERDTLVAVTVLAKNYIESLTTELQHARAQQKLRDTQCQELEGKIRGKEEEICSLQESLLFQQMETEKLKTVVKVQKESNVVEQDFLRELALFKNEMANKSKFLEKIEEQQKQTREMEEKWLTKEKEWLYKMGKVEEEMKLLIQQNIQLQELSLKTDKEKAKMKKEEKRAKQEAEKRLKQERKQRMEEEKVRLQREGEDKEQ